MCRSFDFFSVIIPLVGVRKYCNSPFRNPVEVNPMTCYGICTVCSTFNAMSLFCKQKIKVRLLLQDLNIKKSKSSLWLKTICELFYLILIKLLLLWWNNSIALYYFQNTYYILIKKKQNKKKNMSLVSLGDYAGCNTHCGSHFIFIAPFFSLWVCLALIQKAKWVFVVMNRKGKI